jgi:ACS family tartrate transporter-like MFS transporter
MNAQIERTAIRKVYLRLLPLLFAAYFRLLSRSHQRRFMHERRWNLFFTCLAAAVGLLGAALLSSSLWALAGIALATIGFYGMKTSFWLLPSTFLSGAPAAAAIAALNSLGNFGGLIGPIAVGWLKDTTGTFEAGLYFLAASALISALVTIITVRERRAAPGARTAGVAAA